MTDVSKFFTALSERAYKENDLSDVTYAMCEADLSFRQFFLDFFFPGQLNASEVTIQREHSTDWGRPDFWIRTNDNKLYIVEVKIWDGSHHFEQYFNILNDDNGPNNLQGDEAKKAVWSRLGYIANYEIEYAVQDVYKVGDKGDAKDLCAVRTWKGFVEELKKYKTPNSSLVEAYVDYLVRVCPYDDFTVRENDGIDVCCFKNVAVFYKIISDIVVKLDGVVPYNRSPRQFQSMRRMGRYFEYTKFKETESSNESSVWGWLGVVYEKVDKPWGARVCVEFEDTPGWGEKVCNKYKGMVKDGVLRFYYEGDLDKDNLRNFVQNVLAERVQPGNAQCDEKLDALLAMKTLPFAIEKYFYGKLNNDWMIERGYDSDEENPNSHCGRYFKLRRISKSGDTSSGKDDIPQGWVGVVFDEQRHFNGKPGGKPVFIVQLPKCEGVFNLDNKRWTQDKCSQYWWNMKLNPNFDSATVKEFAEVFWGCLRAVLSKEDQK